MFLLKNHAENFFSIHTYPHIQFEQLHKYIQKKQNL